MLSDARLSRLIAAALIDQAPFRSKLTNNLVKDGEIVAEPGTAPGSASEKDPFALPNYSHKLVPIEATFLKSKGLFRVSLKSDAKAALAAGKNRWVVTEKRGAQEKELALLVVKAQDALALEFFKQTDRQNKARSILNRAKRYKAKRDLSFWDRTEFVTELRGGASISSGKDNSTGADLEVMATNGSWFNIWLEGHYLRGSYLYQLDLGNVSSSGKVEALGTRQLLTGTFGTGFSTSTDSGHTFFIYPKAEFGSMRWKSVGLSKEYPSDYTDVSFNASLSPGLGLTAGYQSPAEWAIQFQTRISASALNNPLFSSYLVDASGYLATPKWLKRIHTSIGARRGEFMGFGALQFTTIRNPGNSAGTVASFELNAVDIVLGGGYRWLWL